MNRASMPVRWWLDGRHQPARPPRTGFMHLPCRLRAMARLEGGARVPMIAAMRLAVMSMALLLVAVAGGMAAPAGIQGLWLTENKSGVVEIFPCGDRMCGRLAWFRIKPGDPNPQALDIKNPDPARRGQSLCDLVFMHGFKPAGPDDWEDGNIYDPE